MSAPRSLPAGLKPYRVSSAFGIIRNINGRNTPPHNGADWATPTGIPLEATMAGKVSLVGGSLTHIWGYYVHVICHCPLKHVQEFHILRDAPRFKIGDRISLGQVIGHTGSSGALNGKRYAPHHHHGTSVGGKYYDPLTIGWATLLGDTASTFDNTEDDMPLTPADLNAIFNYRAYTGGPTFSEVLKVLDGRTTPELVKAVWESPVRRGDVKVSALQELADTKTILIRQEAQILALSNALSLVAAGSPVDVSAIRAEARKGAEDALKSLTLTAKVGG